MAVARIGEVPVAEARIILPRLSLETAGLFTLLLGAWAALVPFVGPLFGYSADGSASWHWTSAHVYLFLIPGAVAFMCGLFTMIATVDSARSVVGFCGVLTIVCGAWLVIGPVAWPVLAGSSFFRTDVSSLHQLANWIGYSLGPGGLLLALGAFIVGSDRPRIARPAMTEPAGYAGPVASGPVASGPVATDARAEGF